MVNTQVEIPKGTFWAEDKQMLYLVRCPKCKSENWGPAVATGVCAWCGYDVNNEAHHENTTE